MVTNIRCELHSCCARSPAPLFLNVEATVQEGLKISIGCQIPSRMIRREIPFVVCSKHLDIVCVVSMPTANVRPIAKRDAEHQVLDQLFRKLT